MPKHANLLASADVGGHNIWLRSVGVLCIGTTFASLDEVVQRHMR